MGLQYKTQRYSYRFFIAMLIFFALQVTFGLLMALQHMDPKLLQGIINFNVGRAFHLNLAVVWIVTGFIGTILFVGPLLGKREVKHKWVIKFLFIALIFTVAWTAATLPLAQFGIGGWIGNTPWLQQGKEFLEAGRVSHILLFVAFCTFAYLTLYMFPRKTKNWNELHWGLAVGVVGLAAVWVFSFISSENLDTQEYFRWYVVHYWVEAVWEVIHITLIGFLLQKFFGAHEKEVGFAVFWGVSLVILSGLIGNSHHYFWIGTPAFWQFWGSLFSALEPLPLIFCIWHIYLDEKHGVAPIKNKVAFYFLFGSALFESVGAGILGFTMTMAYANIWSHGTWITASHGHMALFGAFGLLVFGAAYEAIRQYKEIDTFKDRLSKLGFWMMFGGLMGIISGFAIGGTKQIYVYRILGLDWWGHHIRPSMNLGQIILGVSAFVFILGANVLIFDLFTLKNRAISERERRLLNTNLSSPKRISSWRKAMSPFEFVMWIAALWSFGLIITAGVFSFNLTSVRMGNPTIPYVLMLAIGYPGLVLTTVIFAMRFLAAFEQRQSLLHIFDNLPENRVGVLDLRHNGHHDDVDRLIFDTYNGLEYGEGFMLVGDHSLRPKHLALFEAVGSHNFVWVDVEHGPEEWKAKIGKLN